METPDKPELSDPPDESPEPAKDEPDAPKLPATTAEPEVEKPKAMTVKALAERLEIRPQDLYQQLMIDVGSGEKLSLSELKDAGTKLHKAEKILTDAETTVRERENDLLRKQHAQSLREPSESELADADKSWTEFVRKENAATLGVITAWKDPAQQRADLADMATLLSSYGVSGAEIGRFADHRLVKQLYDHLTLKRRLDAATDAEVTKNPAPVVKAKRKSAPKSGAKAVEDFKAGRLTEVQAVAALIAEG